MAEYSYIILFTGIIFFVITAIFYIGKNTGRLIKKNRHLEEQKNLERTISTIETSRKELLREIENLKHLNEKYVYFIVRIPETVKNLNSTLTFDETISSVIRFTKDIIDTDCIEFYIYNDATKQFDLEASYGSNKKKKISISIGEGVIGKAAENKVITTQETLLSVSKTEGDKIFLGAPVMFRDRIIGVLGLGKIKNFTANEKRLIAMITDLAGVSLQNCERLSNVQVEANTDSLTRLYNRKYLLERALDEAKKAASYDFPISFFMFDIDNFKKYNDTNGHAEGDYLLKELARLLKENTRGRDIIARYGGEEFIVLLLNTNKEGALLYGEKIRKLTESEPFRHREKQPLGFVSISGGVATFPYDGDTIESVIKAADSALYKAKEAGRNRVIKYEPFRLT